MKKIIENDLTKVTSRLGYNSSQNIDSTTINSLPNNIQNHIKSLLEEFPEYVNGSKTNYTITNNGVIYFTTGQNEYTIYFIDESNAEDIDSIIPDFSMMASYNSRINPTALRKIGFSNGKFIPEKIITIGNYRHFFINADSIDGCIIDDNNNYFKSNTVNPNNITRIKLEYKPFYVFDYYGSDGVEITTGSPILFNEKAPEYDNEIKCYYVDVSDATNINYVVLTINDNTSTGYIVVR